MRVTAAYGRTATSLFIPVVILLVQAVPIRADGAVGRTAGQFSVGTTGDALYSIPLWTPPGTNGLAPSLSLKYSSTTGNGYLGNGFSISGLSVLARCNATKAQDTNAHGVNFVPADKYCVDGHRLRLVSGTYAAANSTYQTELETFRRITLKATDANGAVWWEVKMRDGLTYEYGNTADSRIRLTTGSGSLSTKRLFWAVNRIRDRAGNYIDFSYVQDATNGGYYPKEIRWTGNTNGTVPAYKAVFTSESAERPDVVRNFFPTAPSGSSGFFNYAKRLSRIEVLYVPTSRIVRKFQFTYEAAGGTEGLSRLESVVECGLDGIDCLAPTTVSWNTPGWSIVSASSGVTVPSGVTPFVMDISGDGRDDVVWSSSASSGGGTWYFMLANASGSFSAPVNSGVSNTNHANAQIIEWNGDAKADLIVPLSGNTWWVLQANGTGFNSPFNTGVAYSFPTAFADIDGDGRDDLVRKLNGISMRLRSGTGFGAETVAYVPPWPVSNIHAINSQRSQDFDGDGREDLVIVIDQVDAVGNHTFKTQTVFGNSTNIIFGLDYGVVTYIGSADFNGDKRSDIAWLSGGILRTSINPLSGPVSSGSQGVVLTDWDGDAKDDALIPSGGNWKFARSTGAGFAAVTSTNIAVLASRVGDVDGDSFKDLVGVEANAIKYIRHSTSIPWQFRDLVQTVTDGFGVAATFTYGSLADPAVHTPSSGAEFPTVDVNTSAHSVVKKVVATDGSGNSSTYALTFTYEGARRDERKTLSFAKRTIIDNRLGYNFKTEEIFEQAWPFTGLRKKYTLKQSSGTVIRETTNTWNALTYNPGFSGRSYPYISTTVTKQYEAGGTHNGALLRTITSTLPGTNGAGGIDSTSGLIKDMTTTTVEGGTGLFPGYSKSERVKHSTFLNDLPNWCIGRPQTSELVNSHTAPAGGSITRSLAQAWDGPSCRLSSRTVEAGNAQWQVTTALTYDGFGNLETQTVTGAGMIPRVTTIDWGTSGQVPLATTNALSQTTNRTYQPETGLLRTVTDANGLTTTRDYDNFGRLTLETRSDATKTAWTYAACPTGCDTRVRYTVQEQMRKVDNSPLRTDTHHFDRYDRVIYTFRQLASGSPSITSVVFDARGRATRRYVPAWSTGANGYEQIGYDSLDRVTSEGLYTSGGTLKRQTTYTYSGLAVTTTDPRLYVTTETATAWGDLARVADPAGGFTNYEHNAFGELTKVTDAAGNTVSSIVRNVRGMKVNTIDADLGAWTLVPNALGELSSQTDPRGNTTTFQYDALGRMKERSEIEGTTNWTWGSSAAAKNIGQLQSTSSPGYSETFSYDSLARLSTRTITTDATYQIAFGYDAQTGLLSTLTYPVSTSGYRFKLQYEYAYGFLSKVKRFDTPFTEYWKLDTVDARANVIDESLGNGIRIVTGFDPLTGLIDYRQSGPPAEHRSRIWRMSGTRAVI